MKGKNLSANEGLFKCAPFVITANSPHTLGGGGQEVPAFFLAAICSILLSQRLGYWLSVSLSEGLV